jgi:hypothetical protein
MQCIAMLINSLRIQKEEAKTIKAVFSDEATFRISKTANRPNCRVWSFSQPNEHPEHETDTLKMNVQCALTD